VPNKTFHIPDDEVALWEAAQRVATKRRTSVYRILSTALQHELPRLDAEPVEDRPADPWAHIAADAA
jgi:hypothetical protein